MLTIDTYEIDQELSAQWQESEDDIPEEPDQWSLDDFSDLLTSDELNAW